MRVPEVVVDSSVLLKWFIPEDYHEEAKALLRDHLLGRVTAASPAFALLEFANALRKYVVRGLIDTDTAEKILGLLAESPPRLLPEDPESAGRALSYALENGVTVYDARYVVAARDLGTVLYTTDERLLRSLRGRKAPVAHVAEYRPAGTTGRASP